MKEIVGQMRVIFYYQIGQARCGWWATVSNGDGVHAGGVCGTQAGVRVFEYQALLWRQIEAFGGH